MLANRLRKNLKRWRRWAEDEGVSCYRLYDADLPEYALAIDLYEGAAVIQEYAPPATVDAEKAGERLREAVCDVVPTVLALDPGDVFLRVRHRQRRGEQYERLKSEGATRVVYEGGHRFEVNLSDYLDTGLFLDHRQLRAIIQREAASRHFLNLFSYTGSATVYAAKGGALSTVSVDLSNTYLAWTRRNLLLNDIEGSAHELVRADCLRWIENQRRRFDLILAAPPTFSTSKKMTASFDVERDHPAFLKAVARLLSPTGVLFFSTHRERFRLNEAELGDLMVAEITARTMPADFGRRPRYHRSWRITRTRG